ncbi:unnamed protein product [Ectocarpus sp. 12 AP-2014]
MHFSWLVLVWTFLVEAQVYLRRSWALKIGSGGVVSYANHSSSAGRPRWTVGRGNTGKGASVCVDVLVSSSRLRSAQDEGGGVVPSSRNTLQVSACCSGVLTLEEDQGVKDASYTRHAATLSTHRHACVGIHVGLRSQSTTHLLSSAMLEHDGVVPNAREHATTAAASLLHAVCMTTAERRLNPMGAHHSQ